MTPRNTSTGAVLEAMVLPALDRGGYTWRVQIETGTRPGGPRAQQLTLWDITTLDSRQLADESAP